MTSPSSSTSSAVPTSERISGDSVEAVQAALAAEHAAAWTYGLASAFLPAGLDAAVQEGMAAHQARRDATIRLIRDAGGTPVAAEASYLPPQPVKDQPSAIALLATAENDAAAAWRAVLEHTDDAGLRQSAMEGLTASAVRGTRWRKTGGLAPLSVAFPGQP